MTVLSYKSYQGSVQFEDGQLVVEVLHVDDLLTATCDSAAAAQKVFEDLVDDYLETCQALGREPNKPFKGSFNVRLTPALHREAAMAAAASHCSLNAWVVQAIEERLQNDKMKKQRYLAEMQPHAIARRLEDTPVVWKVVVHEARVRSIPRDAAQLVMSGSWQAKRQELN